VSRLFDLPFDEPETEDDLPAAAVPVPASPPEARERVRTVYTVSELNARIRDLLETTFIEVWVEGELSNCRLWNTGHLYFTLKDSSAQVKAVMFRSDVRYLKFKPEDGLHVIARGRLSVYEPKGEYQFVCAYVEPKGLGALQLAFDQLKKRLHAEGLFDASRKRPLPVLPRKIGIVTSLDGAAIRDIIKVLRRRYPNAHLVISPTRVQGDGAAEDIARSVRMMGRVRDVDVMIVGRGGGSIEDLWAFNEEVVARAIIRSPVPVISGVGHEVDVTIADLVADVRAPTPSAAAELVVSRRDDFCTFIDRLTGRLRGAIDGRLARLGARVHEVMRRPAISGWPARLAMRGRHVAELTRDLHRAGRSVTSRRLRRYQVLRAQLEARDIRRKLADVRHRLMGVSSLLQAAVTKRYHRADARFKGEVARLESLSPLAVLGRGYAVLWNADRTAIVRDARTVSQGDRVHVTLHRGELECEVKAAGANEDSDQEPVPPGR
jgi:exodeoxyribonuclease VII large subunit